MYGKEKYGLLVIAFTITSFFSGFTNLGAKATLNKIIPKLKTSKDRTQDVTAIIITGSILVFCGASIVGLLLYLSRNIIIGFYNLPHFLPVLIASVFYLFFFSILDFIFSVYQAFQDWVKESLLSVLYPLFYLVLIGISFCLFRKGIETVLYSNIISAFFISGVGIFYLKEHLNLRKINKYDYASFKSTSHEFIKFGIPLLIPQASALLVMWADKLILGKYASIAELSLYYIAYSFITGLLIFIKTIFTIAMPYFAEFHTMDSLKNKFDIFFKLNIYLSMFISLSMFVLIDRIVTLMYGGGYEKVGLLFKFMIPLIFMKSLLLAPAVFMQNVYSMVKVINIGGILLGATDILMCIFLVPRYGAIGAVVSVLGAHFLYTCWLFLLIPAIRKLIPFRSIINALLISIVLISVYYLMFAFKLNSILLLLTVLTSLFFIFLFVCREDRFILQIAGKAFRA
ncbi:MAG: hypothetical protein A2Y00_03085 [Omnitrophica WOR_2 bacterium GWF2_43_52]|nr:MAG: hypothetical protein A2Y00_03085 [Omnitrophica WOR_2 bacterium GWF2_43_52]